MPDNRKISLGANRPIILDSHDNFWMVIAGEVDVYNVEIAQDGTYTSQLNHLCKAGKGELLFSLLNSPVKSGIKLLVVSSQARLLELNQNNLMDIDPIFLKYYVNKWISKLAKELYTEKLPRIYKVIGDEHEFSLDEGEVAYPYKDLLWCSLIEGDVSKYADSVSHNFVAKYPYPFPVSGKLWLKSLTKDTKLKVLSTKEVLKDDIFFMLSLKDIQKHFYEKIIDNHRDLRLKEKARIEYKINTDGERLHATLQELGAIVSNKSNAVDRLANKLHVDSNNLLLATCQLIGNEVGFSFIAPKFMESYNDSTNNQLFAIGQASNVRIRKVILRGSWWKEENGYMLAFSKEGKRPLALLQKDAKTYVIKDIETNTEESVTREIAENLEPIAYMFFFAFDRKMTSLKKIMGFAIQGVKRDAKYLILAAFAGSLLGLLVPVLSGVMFDDVIPTADRSMLFEVFGIMLIIGVVTALLQLIQGVLQLRVETKSNVNLQGGLMDHLLRLPVSFYKKYTAGDLTNRALSVNAIRQILSGTLMTAVLSGAFSAVNLLLLFYYDSSLAWVGVGLAFVAVLFIVGIGWLKLKYDRDISDEQGNIQGFLFEFLSGITKIRITGAEKRIFTLWAEKFANLKKLAFRSGSYQNYIEVFNGSYPLLTNIFFFSFIYYTVTTTTTAEVGLISVGAFMAFISAFNQFLNDSLKMSMALISSLNIVTLYERVKPILEETPESTHDSTDPGELSGEIELNGVSFRYNEDQPLVLKNISLKIKAGEMVALIGPSGSGKSTVMRILLGFEEPEAGSVYYDGNAFDSMNKDLVRRQIGVVLQNGALMSGSIYKNLVGNSELNLDDAWEAARMAGMEEDIKQMPMEMHTMVSEGAGTFSGGQRQRLMIARAIVHKPRLLFMDEATSALDNRTQNIVSESLDNLQATRIVIAHRLSTIINTDRIYVMDKGEIVESGTYDELIKNNGLFSHLAKRQLT